MPGQQSVDILRTRIRRYDFYSAIHTLIKMGYTPGKDLRLVPRRGTHFPGSDLDSLQPGIPFNDLVYDTESDRKHLDQFMTLVVNTMGLFGPDSSLPFYFNYIISTDIDTGPNLAGLLEILNDRMYQSMYKVWSIPRRLDRTQEDVHEDQNQILSCCGLNNDLLPIPAQSLNVSYMMHPTRSAWGLARLAQDTLGVDVSIDQGVPFRIKLDPEAQSRLGAGYCHIGNDMVLGDKITDISMYYRVKFGPMDHDDFLQFLPAGSKYKAMLGVLDLYTPFHIKYEVELKVQKEEVKKIKWELGGQTSRLGFATVMKSEKKTGDLVARWRKRDDGVERIEREK